MDRAASFDEDNSDSDYMNVSSSEESSEENEFPAKRRNLPLTKRKDALEIVKNPLQKVNIRQSASQVGGKMSLKRKFSFASNATTTASKKENDGGSTSTSTINFQIMSASRSPDELSLTPTMEIDLINNPSLLMPAPLGSQQSNDEPPYFPEKFGGKLCAFCNLGERSQLGQGEMLRLEVTDEDSSSTDPNTSNSSLNDEDSKSDDLSKLLRNPTGANTTTLLQQQLNRRQKGLNKCKNPVNTTEYVDELEKIGHQEVIEFNMLTENGFYYVHRACAMWSFGVERDPVSDALSNVAQVLKLSLSKKCSFCNHFGASASCKINCQRVFHYPCIAASGSFQVFQTSTMYCIDHLNQVPLSCSEDVSCRNCGGLGDISNLMMCSLCGDHYHGTCIGLAQQPGVRAGWQCKTCRSCQICRIPDTSDGRTLACETCDKLYHAQCLRPIMATIPKYGWKCRCCRVCSDCGSRTPGAGASSRWHNHYTVCDSCYQQRNKGYSCPICRKAYRAAAYREMVKCNVCQKFVHSTCDPEADLNAYERRKELHPDYEYTCGVCKNALHSDRASFAIRRSNSGDDDSLSASQESLNLFDDIDLENGEGRMIRDDFAMGLGKGKPFVASKIAKKRLGLTGNGALAQRPKGMGKLGFQKRARTFELGRKRGPKSKMRGIFGVPGIGLQRPVSGDSKQQSDDEPGSENRLILCSAKDRFVLTQDICVMCGSIGTDQEGCLIACAQCGQCYHPYCVSVKVTREILQKGWRCLDCTVCEGCGEKNDEARLILCDDCDISYHIYCMEPPLSNVPQGTWKCKWCAICFKCGSNEPGNNCNWQNSYTECGPCASQSNCSVCAEIYSDGELIIQCTSCDRWLHCQCDSIKNESEAEKCAEEGYLCLLCRPKEIQPPHLQMLKKKLPSFSTQSSIVSKDDSIDESDNIFSLALESSHFVDGVYLSEHGLQFIKTLQTEPKRAKRKPKINVEAEKDAGILAAIESVVAGSADNSMEDVKMEPMDPNEEAQIYKDGMPWSSNEPPPEGFSVFTTETGLVVLRKKRQRNLQKLGIGGFSVRNRAVRTTKNEEEPSNLVAMGDDGKKKKPNRRKQKNKLVETYPAYLQEAFFGKLLMDPNVKVKLESGSSDDDAKSNVSDDKTIKLSLDELKMIEAMRAKQQLKLQEEQKLLQLNIAKTQPASGTPQNATQLISSGAQIQLNQKMQSDDFTQASNVANVEIKTEIGLMDDEDNNSDTEALKDVLGLPNDLLDNDLVNTIMNEDDDLTKNSNVLDDGDVKGVKDDFNIDFNLDMEDMLFKSVLTDESQESQESVLTNSINSYSTQSTPSHQPETQPLHINQPTTPMQATMAQLQSPQATTPTTPINPMSAMQPQSPQIINTQQINPMNQHMMMQQQQSVPQMHMQPMMQRQNSLPTGVPGMTPQRGYNFSDFGYRNQFNTTPTFPQQAQWNPSVSVSGNDFDMGGDMSGQAGPSGQPPKVNNHQKTSERMCEDEKLGDMSTISAVLYANQNHPELKMEYPHWPDRYKQIMKKWRALSADKKQPYLQRARDNRSAQQAQLRTKKAQQVAPELSPDNGTTTSTNSTSPALSSTLSESSSLMDVSIMQQQPTPQPVQQQASQQVVATTTNVILGQQQIQVDQDKIAAQQKSMKEAEQERQWKMLQAQRAREQQLGIPPDLQHSNMPLQISTNMNDGSMSPVASPSPNSRNQFIAPPSKGRMMMNPQVNPQLRPVAPQLQRQQSQRMNHSPFSPQGGTPQSPNDLYPGSPSGENFSRPDEQQFLHSPQTPKPMGQQQSPVHAPGTPNSATMSPVYGQPPQQTPNIRPLENMGQYVQAPGTPRPSFNPGQTRTTVYARPDMFSKPPFIQSPQPNQDQNNRQLRDLLQRTQAPTNLPGPAPQGTTFNLENEVMKSQQNQANQQAQNQISDNTFRQPLPPGMRQPQQRMQSMVGGQMIRSTQLVNPPQRMIMTPDNRPRQNIRPGLPLGQQMMDQTQMIQQQPNQVNMNQQRMTLNPNQQFNPQQGDMMVAQGPQGIMINNQPQIINQRVMNPNMQHAVQTHQIPSQDPNVPPMANQQSHAEGEGIPDSVTAELEKLEQDENVGAMDGVGDILGGLGDDDDDLLNSLTAEMGDDFNILEYADPELETDEKSTLLDSLEMDESDNTKEEKLKNAELEKAKTHFAPNASATGVPMNQQVPQNPVQQNRMPMQVNQNQPIMGHPQQLPQPVEVQNQLNQNAGPSQQNQMTAQQQMVHAQQQQQANFQRQQVRFKAIPPNQIPEIQQIHQQMMLQLQQAAAAGKPMPIGTRLVANNNITGIVTGPNNISLTFPAGQQRLQQVRMVNPNMMQGNQQGNPRMALPQMNPQQQVRPNIVPQQNVNPNMQTMIGQQQSQQIAAPPPPYPEPPPPYPGIQGMQPNQNQEQPLLLEDLLEQEKREQARNINPNQMDVGNIQNQQSLFSDQDYEKLRADVLTTTTQGIPMPQQQVSIQNQPQQQPQFAPRGMVPKQWRGQTPIVSSPTVRSPDIVRSVPIFQANLQAAPPLPPENIMTEADKQTQVTYEAWLNQQNDSLQQQLRYYETEIGDLRKLKKSLITKQRQLKKNGNDLNETDQQTLLKVTQEQQGVQKHLENSRKQARNHSTMKQDYENKQKAKQMAQNPHMVQSPVPQMNDQSPMMSPSPNIMQQNVQSPHGSQIMAPSQSPLHSPSPMMQAPSPGPNSILQSPGAHINNAMSPYNTMQQSPRIGTPHSQIDESPFSPNSGQIDSPQIGRLTSPVPRMTSPQHRPNTPMQIQMMNRMAVQPNQFQQQQNMAMNQQNRFIRPQMIPNDSNSRMGMRMPAQFQQQMSHNPNVIRQVQYDPNGNPQQIQNMHQQNMQNQQNQQVMDPQRVLQMRQMQMARQQQMMKQQQQQAQQVQHQQNQQQQQQQNQMAQMNQMHQMNMQNAQMQNMQSQPNQSPVHQQPQSPLINQNVTSPMINYQQHQNPNSPMMGIDSSPRPVYMQQQSMMDHSNNNQQMQMQGGGGGGMNHPDNPIPAPADLFGSIKLGLRGGMPMWGNGSNQNNKQQKSNTAEMLAMIKKVQEQQQQQAEAQKNIQARVVQVSELQKASTSRQMEQKPKTSLLKNPLATKVKSLVDYDDNDSSNGTPPISPLSQKVRQRLQGKKNDDVVIVDSSPDEKQRLVDYEDDNEKMVVTEVSLNSTAQDIGDSDSIIDTTFDRSELISSPLVTEPETTDYALFESHVVLDDSNESLKEIINTDIIFDEPVTSEPKPSTSKPKPDEVLFVVEKEKNPKNVGTREDFEAMIDSGKDEDENESESEVIAIEKCEQSDQENPEKVNIAKTRIVTSIPEKREIKIPVVFSSAGNSMLTLPANLMNRANITATSLGPGVTGAQRKIVNTGNQTTAKVNIGNTTISVPVVLKNMPTIQGTQDAQSGAKKIITTSALNISNLKKNSSPTLINVSGQKILISHSNIKSNTRSIQAVDIKQRLQQKPGQQSIIVPVTCIASSFSNVSSSNMEANLVTSQGMIVSKLSSSGTPILTFSSKMPQLTVTQDTSLPTKILEDEDVSESIDESKEKSTSTSSSEPMEIVEEGNKETPDSKPKSLIPVHVIIKQRESSQSPIASVSTTTQHRLTSGNGNMSQQLSPLSQPIEINTNTHNATQQIRSILSSIDSNEDTKSKTELDPQLQQQHIVTTQSSVPKTIIRSTSTPTSLGDTKIIISQAPASVASSIPSSNIQTSQPNNVLYVKQIKTIPSSMSASNTPHTSTIVVVSQPGQVQSQGSSVITINKQSNRLIDYLSSQQASKSDATKMEPPLSVEGMQKSMTMFKSNPTITNLLNANANSFKRSKSSDDVVSSSKEGTSDLSLISKRLSLEVSNEIKTEPLDSPVIKEAMSQPISIANTTTMTTVIKTEPMTVSPVPQIMQKSQKNEDSQNVLLKQLLQNSGSSNPVGQINRPQPVFNTTQRAPSLGMFSSLEAQLARPIIPPTSAKPIIVTTQSSLVPSIISQTPINTSENVTKPTPTTPTMNKVSLHETSFVSQPAPAATPPTTISSNMTITSPISDKKPVVVLNRNDIPASMLAQQQQHQAQVVPKTTISLTALESGMAPPNFSIKKEIISPNDVNPGVTILNRAPSQSPTQQTQPFLIKSVSQSSIGSGTTTPVPIESPHMDIKKEMDDSSQSESISSDVSMIKVENIQTTPSSSHGMDESPAKTAQEIANELKKKKRREYQKNRRQMQLSKEKGGLGKKTRKLPKSEEDYDSFIDNLMIQIKSLPQMQILEPLLPKNFGVCAIYGSQDLHKVNSLKRYNTKSGELSGCFGKGELSSISDFYNTKPFGPLEPKVEKVPTSTQRGFYDQEFPPIKFDDESHQRDQHRNKYDILGKDRDIDTPETVVSSSSPECVMTPRISKFPGLRLIREEEETEDEDEMVSFIDGRMSPSIPTIIAPIPIRLKTGISLTNDSISLSDKENEINKQLGVKSCFEPPATLKDNNNNNVTVTLTLTSSAAEDIMGVLKSLANILNIPAPTAYQIVERTTTPPSQKLGLYRIKGKDGKEGQPVDLQTILNGTAKFCRHCDVVILNNAIKAKANEFPLLVNTELESDELYFCGQTCYKQFQWRPINMMDDKNLNSTSDEKALENMSESIAKIEGQSETPSKDKGSESLRDLKRKHDEIEDISEISREDMLQAEKRQKMMRIKTFSANSFPQIHKQKKLTEREITEMLFRMNITVNSAPKILEDSRKCILCHQAGDGVADGPSQLLNYDVDKWVHLNCALWSEGVYETVNGALMNFESAVQTSLNSQCTLCNHLGASVKCFKARCGTVYHLSCAMKDNCVFYKNKTTMCNIHAPKSEKDNELTTLSVQRRVYIERDENRQVASIMHHSDLSNLLRVGSAILLNVGQLLPHQLQTFHTPNCIYPIGYKVIRFFWSMRQPNKRCRYICSIADVAGRPEFRIHVKEVNEEDIELRDETPKKVWLRILEPIAKLRRAHQLVHCFPKYINGDDLFGLTEPAIVRILESLPGVETLHDYRFKYGRNPLLELPLAINPSGAARTEPRLKHAMPRNKPHTQRTGSSSQRPAFVPSTSHAGEVACPYSKQFVHSKSSQYKKMKLEWRNNVFLARSKIQGLGLYAARDLEKHTMVIEYIGEVIRGELSELREKQYEARNRGIYMFRLDEDRVIDATLSGGLARYINHSCSPNCTTEIVEVDREYRIIIFAKRRINRGEELSYDYKFDIEDESRKIACHCGAAFCKKYMN